MLETTPNHQGASVFEFDFVEYYWMEWFNAMGVVAFIYPHEQKIGVIEGRIQEFLKK
jgi:hypothetical protein